MVDLPKPVPAKDELLIRVCATTVSSADWRVRSLSLPAGPAEERIEYMHQLAHLAAQGQFTPVIDRCYPFDEMREAHRHVDSGRKRGNVVIRVGREAQ